MDELNRAYNVLSDPIKRTIYDKYGHLALRLYETKKISEQNIHIFFNIYVIGFVGIFLLFVLLVSITFPILFSLQVDQFIRINWLIVCSPLFIIDFLLVIVLTLALRYTLQRMQQKKIDETSSLSQQSPPSIGILFFISVSLALNFPVIMIFLFEFLLCLELNQTTEWGWWIIFSPLIAMELSLIYIRISINYRRESHPKSCILTYSYICQLIYPYLLCVCTTILIALNLEYSSNLVIDGELEDKGEGIVGVLSWWLVFVPIFCWIFFDIILLLIQKLFLLSENDLIEIFDERGGIIKRPKPLFIRLKSISIWLVYYGLILCFVVLFVMWIDSFEFATIIVFIPFFIFLFFSSCFIGWIYLNAVLVITKSRKTRALNNVNIN